MGRGRKERTLEQALQHRDLGPLIRDMARVDETRASHQLTRSQLVRIQTDACFGAHSGRPLSPRKPATRPLTAAAKLRVDPTAKNSPVLRKDMNTVHANQRG